MPRYSEEFKEQVVRKMMAPNAISVAQVSRDTGVSEQTLYNWRNRFRNEGKAVPADPSNPEHWSGENKLAVVIETAGLNEEELAEYCRRNGLYVEQVARWREISGCFSSPQTNGICERFHKTILQEFFQVTLRKKIYTDLASLQVDLDEWLVYYNTERTHQGKMCCGRTPMETLQDGKQIWQAKLLN